MCGTQVLKTTLGENVIGCFTQNDPCPIIVWQPREADVRYFSNTGIDPMFSETPSLRSLVAPKKSRDAGNTITEKQFLNGSLTMLGATSEANMRMRSARVLFLDEVDEWEKEFPGHGSPVELAMGRSDNFPNRKIIIASSPTLQGTSTIEYWWLRSDQRRYFMPCPFCDHGQTLVWSPEYAWRPTEGGVVWGNQPEGYIEPVKAAYRCEHCKRLIPNWKKPWMIDQGLWGKQSPESDIAGFHLSREYSPITSWGKMAVEFIAASGDPVRLQSFVNTKLAEVWKQQGDAPDWEVVASRAENYEKGTVPAGASLLTGGVDIQADRIEFHVWGRGRNKERWLVDHQIFWGPTVTLDCAPWQALTAAINDTWPHESGSDMSLSKVAVDSGYLAAVVYDWARRQTPGLVMVVKGYDSGVALVGQPKTTETVSKRQRRGVLVYPINVSMAKAELYGQLRAARPAAGDPYPTGWVHHYRESDAWYKELVSERFVQTKDRRGVLVGHWQKMGRNEALDCANMANAAAEHIGVSKAKEADWDRIEAQILWTGERPARAEAVATAQPVAQQPPPPPAPARRAGGWMSGGGRSGRWI